jgi:hypothetical protein
MRVMYLDNFKNPIRKTNPIQYKREFSTVRQENYFKRVASMLLNKATQKLFLPTVKESNLINA